MADGAIVGGSIEPEQQRELVMLGHVYGWTREYVATLPVGLRAVYLSGAESILGVTTEGQGAGSVVAGPDTSSDALRGLMG